MELVIEKLNKDQDLSDFIYGFLFSEIEKEFIKRLDPKALEPISEYINSPAILMRLKEDPAENIHINLYKAAIAAIQHLECTNTSDAYVIGINPTETIPKITAKLIDLASLINYGSMMSPAYPIYDEVFDSVADDMQAYYNIFSRGGQS